MKQNKQMELHKFPSARGKVKWINDLDDLIGNYDIFARKWDVNPKYDWFDVLYSFIRHNILLKKSQTKKELVEKIRKFRDNYIESYLGKQMFDDFIQSLSTESEEEPIRVTLNLKDDKMKWKKWKGLNKW